LTPGIDYSKTPSTPGSKNWRNKVLYFIKIDRAFLNIASSLGQKFVGANLLVHNAEIIHLEDKDKRNSNLDFLLRIYYIDPLYSGLTHLKSLQPARRGFWKE
jgi:hypothetical protein